MMNESWRVDTALSGLTYIVGPTGDIALMRQEDKSTLIAAAPDLLAALETAKARLAEAWRKGPSGSPTVAMNEQSVSLLVDIMSAAIRKATGHATAVEV